MIEKVSSSKRLSLDRVRALLNEFKEGLRILYSSHERALSDACRAKRLEGEFSQLAASSIGQVTAITNMTTNLTQSLAAMPERNHSLIKPQITNAQAALEKLSTIGLKAEPQHHLLQTQFAAQLISGAAVIAPSISYESSQQALSARSEIDRLLSRVRHVVDFSTYQALDELQVAFDLEMQSLIAALPKEKIAPKVRRATACANAPPEGAGNWPSTQSVLPPGIRGKVCIAAGMNRSLAFMREGESSPLSTISELNAACKNQVHGLSFCASASELAYAPAIK